MSTLLAPYQSKHILITGAAGYVGCKLVSELSHVNCHLKLITRSGSALTQHSGKKAEVTTMVGDVTETTFWQEHLPDADFVFHLASYEQKGDDCQPHSNAAVNTLSTLHLLEVCRQKGLRPKIVFASSANIAGKGNTTPINETHTDEPLSLFSLNKQMAEKYITYYAREFDIDAIALRLTNVYGPVPNDEKMSHVVLNYLIGRAIIKKSLSLFANQHCIRDFVYIDDVIQAFLAAPKICSSERGRYFIIGSGESATLADTINLIAKQVEEQLGEQIADSTNKDFKLEPMEWRNFIADTAVFRQATQWKPKTKLTEGIEQTIDHFLRTTNESS